VTDDAMRVLVAAMHDAWTPDDEPDTRPIERPNPLADPVAQRVANLLGTTDLTRNQCAKLLRRLAHWYRPTLAKLCQHCERPHRRRSYFCSDRCKHRAYRARLNRRESLR